MRKSTTTGILVSAIHSSRSACVETIHNTAARMIVIDGFVDELADRRVEWEKTFAITSKHMPIDIFESSRHLHRTVYAVLGRGAGILSLVSTRLPIV